MGRLELPMPISPPRQALVAGTRSADATFRTSPWRELPILSAMRQVRALRTGPATQRKTRSRSSCHHAATGRHSLNRHAGSSKSAGFSSPISAPGKRPAPASPMRTWAHRMPIAHSFADPSSWRADYSIVATIRAARPRRPQPRPPRTMIAWPIKSCACVRRV